MGGKQMEGDNRERRKRAKEARHEGERPSEGGATLGASQQRTEAEGNAGHQERLDLKREGKPDQLGEGEDAPEAGTRGRDEHGPRRRRYPRL